MEEDFKAASLEYNSIETQIKEFKKAMKDLMSRKKLLGKFIREYMASNKKETVRVSSGEGRTGGRIQLRTRKVSVPLNRDELMRIFLIYFENNESVATELVEFIMENRGKVERSSISHKVEK